MLEEEEGNETGSFAASREWLYDSDMKEIRVLRSEEGMEAFTNVFIERKINN